MSFAGAGRAVEDHRRRPGTLHQAAQRRGGAEEMALPDDLVEGGGPHPHRQREDVRDDGLADGSSFGMSNRLSGTGQVYHARRRPGHGGQQSHRNRPLAAAVVPN